MKSLSPVQCGHAKATWSDQARLAQRQPGYEWTKTFKAQLELRFWVRRTLKTSTASHAWTAHFQNVFDIAFRFAFDMVDRASPFLCTGAFWWFLMSINYQYLSTRNSVRTCWWNKLGARVDTGFGDTHCHILTPPGDLHLFPCPRFVWFCVRVCLSAVDRPLIGPSLPFTTSLFGCGTNLRATWGTFQSKTCWSWSLHRLIIA